MSSTQQLKPLRQSLEQVHQLVTDADISLVSIHERCYEQQQAIRGWENLYVGDDEHGRPKGKIADDAPASLLNDWVSKIELTQEETYEPVRRKLDFAASLLSVALVSPSAAIETAKSDIEFGVQLSSTRQSNFMTQLALAKSMTGGENTDDMQLIRRETMRVTAELLKSVEDDVTELRNRITVKGEVVPRFVYKGGTQFDYDGVLGKGDEWYAEFRLQETQGYIQKATAILKETLENFRACADLETNPAQPLDGPQTGTGRPSGDNILYGVFAPTS